MREGRPSKRFGHLGLHNVSLGGGSAPVLIKLYDTEDRVIATLTEEQGACIDPGHVDFFRRAELPARAIRIVPCRDPLRRHKAHRSR